MLDPKQLTRVRHRGPASWEPAQLGGVGGTQTPAALGSSKPVFAAKLTGAALNPTFSFVPVPLAGYPA